MSACLAWLRKLVLAARSSEYRAFAKWRLAEVIAQSLAPSYLFSEYGRTWLADGQFMDACHRFGNDRHSIDRKYLLRSLLGLIAGVAGDTAECGVYEGASSFIICKYTAPHRVHHLFDSFAGLPVADDQVDGSFWAVGDLQAPQTVVEEKLKDFRSRLVVHSGWIPESFSEVADRTFAFLHVDVDLYRPTLDSLNFFYPLLAPGGLIVCDDYGFDTCPGARLACDQFAVATQETWVHCPTGQAFLIKGVGRLSAPA